MKKKLWAVLVAFVALTVFATSAFAAVRWRNVASIYPGISAGDNSYTCEISCLSGTTKIDCTLAGFPMFLTSVRQKFTTQ